MKSKIIHHRWIPGIVLLVIVSGCAVGPDFHEPVVASPDTFRTAVMPTESADDLKWWLLFEDPLLFDLVTMALANNRDIQIAVSRIEQARATLGFTRADPYPRVDVDAGAQRGNFTGFSRTSNESTALYLVAPLSWEIDFWGKFKRSTEAARAELFASDFGLKAVQLALITDVVSTYNQLLDFHRRLIISENTLVSRSKSLKIIEQRFDKGIIGKLDVNQAQIQKEIAAAAIPLYERSIKQTENGLAVLLGRLPESIQIEKNLIGHDPPRIPTGLPSEMIHRRPDIIQASFLLRAQTERIGVAEALRLPAISLTGALGVASTDLGAITVDGGVWSVGGRLLGPVIDFGKNKRRVELEEQRTKEALYQYENAVLNAFREVEDALVAIDTYRKELEAVNRQQIAAKSANDLSKERYDKGVSSYLEVLDTERTLFNAELTLSDLQQSYRNAFVSLYKALGGGWITPVGKADANVSDGPERPAAMLAPGQ